MKKSVFLVILMICLLLLLSCDSNKNDQTDTSSADTTITPSSELVSIVSGGATEYKIVRPDGAPDAVTKKAVELRGQITSVCGATDIQISDDFEKRDFDTSKRYKYEILVGYTNRDESAAGRSLLKYNDFIIKLDGTRLVIIGGCDEATGKAVDYFIESFVTKDGISLPGDYEYIYRSEYNYGDIKLLGHSLDEFVIEYSSSYKSYAQTVANEFGEKFGVIADTTLEVTDNSVECEIIVAPGKRGIKNTLGVDDYSIIVDGTKIYIIGGSSYSVGSGCRYLINLIKNGKSELSASDIAVNYVRPDRDVYINDISKLSMHWDITFDVPDWLLDYDEKYAAASDPDGRMMSCLHRGDMVYYPENSIEGIISAVRMGGDMVEIDPRLTKDGVFILMHDATLTRMTNYEDMKGKNGLPTSPNVEDWTFDQIRQLNLKEKNGGTSAMLTDYKIPTLDEAIKVCAERISVRLDVKGPDSGGMYWNYTNDIWPLITKYGAYSTVIFTWHSVFTSSNYNLTKNYKSKMLAASGRQSNFYIGAHAKDTNATALLATIKTQKLDYCVRLTDCDFSSTTPDQYLKDGKAFFNSIKGKARIYIDAQGASAQYENVETWSKLYDAGINYLLVNHGLELVKFIVNNCSPTEK